MDFRALSADMDSAIFETLSDDADIEGRPVRGMFSAPWLEPKIGRLKTGIIEPHIVLRDGDVTLAQEGNVVTVLGADYRVVGIEPDGTGVTVLILRPEHD